MSDQGINLLDKTIANDRKLKARSDKLSIIAGYDYGNDTLREVKVNDKGQVELAGDLSGKQSFNTVFGDAIVATKHDQILAKFNAGIIENFIKSEVTLSGTISESNSRLKVSSGVDTTATARAISRDRLIYSPGHEMFAYFTAAWADTGDVGETQYIGPFDDNDGYGIGFSGDVFQIFRKKGGAIVQTLTQENFPDDTLDGNGPSKFILDHTKINIFRITYGYLGIAPAAFEIYGGHEFGWIHFADLDVINLSQELSIENPNLPITSEIIKLTSTKDLVIYSGSWNGGYYNGAEKTIGTIPNGYNTGIAGIALTGTGAENVVIFKLKDTFNGKVNTAKVLLTAFETKNSAASDTIRARIIANPTFIGGTAIADLIYTDVATNSTVTYSESGGVVVGGSTVYSTYMQGGGQGSGQFSGAAGINAEELGLVGVPGDYFAIVYDRALGSTGIYTALSSLNWIELF